MVKILSTGEIVPDNDPRANSAAPHQRTSNQAARQGYVRHDDDAQAQQMYRHGAGPSVFESLNQRLLDAGIPRWNIGPYVVEPIVSLGFLVALLLIGLHGLLFAVLLFLIAKYSQQGFGENGGGFVMPRFLQNLGFGGFQQQGGNSGHGNANTQTNGTRMDRSAQGGPTPGPGRPGNARQTPSKPSGWSGSGNRLGQS